MKEARLVFASSLRRELTAVLVLFVFLCDVTSQNVAPDNNNNNNHNSKNGPSTFSIPQALKNPSAGDLQEKTYSPPPTENEALATWEEQGPAPPRAVERSHHLMLIDIQHVLSRGNKTKEVKSETWLNIANQVVETCLDKTDGWVFLVSHYPISVTEEGIKRFLNVKRVHWFTFSPGVAGYITNPRDRPGRYAIQILVVEDENSLKDHLEQTWKLPPDLNVNNLLYRAAIDRAYSRPGTVKSVAIVQLNQGKEHVKELLQSRKDQTHKPIALDISISKHNLPSLDRLRRFVMDEYNAMTQSSEDHEVVLTE